MKQVFKNFYYIKVFLLSLVCFGVSQAFAQSRLSFESVEMGKLTIGNAQTNSLQLSHARYFKNLIIQAEGVSSDSTVEVVVNGQIKGTIYAPGRDPSYFVTIEETASSIQFRHRDGGSMRILSVMATVSNWKGRPAQSGGGSLYGREDEVSYLAQRALSAVEDLKYLSSPNDEALYLFPIKKQAGFVLVYSDARGSHSQKATTALIALQNQIDFARPYLESLLSMDDAFDLVVELLSVRESIDELLN